jgi:signal transduction histidine kinase
MTGKPQTNNAAVEKELAERKQMDKKVQRQINLLTAIVRVFKETLSCETEEEVARASLKVAEELTGSAYGFIGELNTLGHFDTTTLSESGWAACKIARPEADMLLKNMPNRGINRIGLQEKRSWIINEPASHPDSIAKPQGHPAITSFMGVPLRYMGGTTGMIALAGRHPGYTLDEQEDVEALAVVLGEVLNRRRAEKKIHDLNEELNHHIQQTEASNKELEAFSYSVSHDLRAPLRHITGFVELLNKRDLSALDEKSRHYLTVISESARKMGTLIDDLLTFSRMSRTEIKKTGIDFGLLVREIISELGEETQGREIIWEIAAMPAVDGDPAMLRQVLVNLIANALKFTRQLPRARIEIGAVTHQPDETLFYVKDNGVGFDMKYVDKLFGLFQRLHSSEEFEGTGVGLANVQRIIHRHGGRVWAEGAVGGGAVFWFSLPKAGGE